MNFFLKFKKKKVVGYLLSIWTILIAVSFNIAVYPDPYHLPYGMRMYPPFGFCRFSQIKNIKIELNFHVFSLIYLLSIACSNQECYSSLDTITEEIKDCLIFLYIGAVFFFLLAIYLHEIIPQDPDENGFAKPPLFFLKGYAKRCKKRKTQLKEEDPYENFEELNSPASASICEDSDVLAERNIIKNFHGNYADYPLICQGLRKQYKKGGQPGKLAVKDFSLAIRNGEFFGLLGPSGAGKTTIISILTGLYAPDQGNAWVAGASIKEEIEKVHLTIGVCQQFDKLWPDLTVEEHLLFYARLRGVSAKEEKAKVEKSLNDIDLREKARCKAKQLSGIFFFLIVQKKKFKQKIKILKFLNKNYILFKRW